MGAEDAMSRRTRCSGTPRTTGGHETALGGLRDRYGWMDSREPSGAGHWSVIDRLSSVWAAVWAAIRG